MRPVQCAESGGGSSSQSRVQPLGYKGAAASASSPSTSIPIRYRMAPTAVASSPALANPAAPVNAKTVPAIVKLAELVNVDVDSMDPAVAKSLIALGVRPADQTSNQILVGDGIKDPANRDMLEGAVRELGSKGWGAVYDRMSVLLCAKNIENITGRVLLQSSPSQAYNTDEIVAHARRYAAEFEKAGISK